jgi:hypothetical protein
MGKNAMDSVGKNTIYFVGKTPRPNRQTVALGFL